MISTAALTPVALLVMVVVVFVQHHHHHLVEANLYDCAGSKAIGKVLSANISGCNLETSSYCRFRRGTNVTVSVEFEAESSFEEAHLAMFVIYRSRRIPFPIEPSEACGNYGFKCPITGGTIETLRVVLPIKKGFPAVSIWAQLELRDSNGMIIICVKTPVKIESINLVY